MISEGVLMKVYCLSSAFSSACLSRNWGGELMKIYKGQGSRNAQPATQLRRALVGMGTLARLPVHQQRNRVGTEEETHLLPAPGGCGSREAWGWCVGSRPSESVRGDMMASRRRIDGCRTKRCKSLPSNWLIKAATPATGATRWLILPLRALSSPLFTMSTFPFH